MPDRDSKTRKYVTNKQVLIGLCLILACVGIGYLCQWQYSEYQIRTRHAYAMHYMEVVEAEMLLSPADTLPANGIGATAAQRFHARRRVGSGDYQLTCDIKNNGTRPVSHVSIQITITSPSGVILDQTIVEVGAGQLAHKPKDVLQYRKRISLSYRPDGYLEGLGDIAIPNVTAEVVSIEFD